MDFVHEQMDDAIIARLAGRLDASAAYDAERNFLNLIGEGAVSLAVDLGKVDFVSSAGLRVLLIVAKKIQQAKGKLVLFNCAGNVRDVLSISGFDKLIMVRPDSAAALAAVR